MGHKSIIPGKCNYLGIKLRCFMTKMTFFCVRNVETFYINRGQSGNLGGCTVVPELLLICYATWSSTYIKLQLTLEWHRG